MAAIDLTYLKKRAQMSDVFSDEKTLAALGKIIPPNLAVLADDAASDDGAFERVVPNKLFRNWIDLIPETARGFMRFNYTDGADKNPLPYIKSAMSKNAFENFQSLVLKDPNESDLFLMRMLLWYFAVLKRPVGLDFGNYEMNAIFNSLPIDISLKKIKIDAPASFADFYRQIMFAKWGLENAG